MKCSNVIVILSFLVLCSLVLATERKRNVEIRAQDNNSTVTATCEICKFMVMELEKYINQTEPQIEKALVQMCARLPLKTQQICDTIVLMYGHQIVSLLLKYGKPEIVCQKLELCAELKHSSTDASIESSIIVTPKSKHLEFLAKSAHDNDAKCLLCSVLIASIEDYVSRNATEKQIEMVLHMVCTHYLPMQYVEGCENIINEYFPKMIEYVKKKYPARVICEDLSLCSKNNSNTYPRELECAGCTYLIKTTANLVKQKSEAGQMKKEKEFTGQVCKQLYPRTYENLCATVLKKYKMELIANIASSKKFNAAAICKSPCAAVPPK